MSLLFVISAVYDWSVIQNLAEGSNKNTKILPEGSRAIKAVDFDSDKGVGGFASCPESSAPDRCCCSAIVNYFLCWRETTLCMTLPCYSHPEIHAPQIQLKIPGEYFPSACHM